MRLDGFDPNGHEDDQGNLVPRGAHPMVVSETEDRVPKAGGQPYIAITIDILDGRAKGRKLWQNFNINHQNPEAQKISRNQLASLCRAVGLLNPTDSQELVGLPFIGVVSHRKDKSSGEMQAVVQSFKSINDTPSTSLPVNAGAATGGHRPGWMGGK